MDELRAALEESIAGRGGLAMLVGEPGIGKTRTAQELASYAEGRGAHGLFESDNFERYYRDVRMGTLHAVSTPDLVREEVGKHLFDIPLGTQPRWV